MRLHDGMSRLVCFNVGVTLHINIFTKILILTDSKVEGVYINIVTSLLMY